MCLLRAGGALESWKPDKMKRKRAEMRRNLFLVSGCEGGVRCLEGIGYEVDVVVDVNTAVM